MWFVFSEIHYHRHKASLLGRTEGDPRRASENTQGPWFLPPPFPILLTVFFFLVGPVSAVIHTVAQLVTINTATVVTPEAMRRLTWNID